MPTIRNLFKKTERTLDKIESLETNYNIAWWNDAIGNKTVSLVEIEKNLLDILKDPEQYKNLNQIKRVIELSLNKFKINQGSSNLREETFELEDSIKHRFEGYRPRIEGKTMSIIDILQELHNSNDSNRLRKVWESTKEIGPLIQEDFKNLVILRNKIANEVGYSNFFEMNLFLSDINPISLYHILKDVEEETRQPYINIKNKIDKQLVAKYNITRPEIWHYKDPFFQEATSGNLNLDSIFSSLKPEEFVNIARFFYKRIGFYKVDSILKNSDLYSRPGKLEHGYSVPIKVPTDVRVVATLSSTEKSMDLLLHELGHSVYASYIHEDLPFQLRQQSHPFMDEGIAEFFGTMTRNSIWLEENVKHTSKEILSSVKEEDAINNIVFMRFGLVVTQFERLMYENPNQDLNSLWWNLVEKYQLIQRPENRKTGNFADYLSKVHLITFPVYYHNYILGKLFTSQLKEILTNMLGENYINCPELSKFLIENIFKNGALYKWDEVMRNIGGELSSKSFVKEFCL